MRLDIIRRGVGVLALGLALVLSGPAVRAADGETLEAARGFVKAMQIDATLDQIIPTITTVMVNLVTRANPGQAAVVQDIMQRHFLPLFQERKAEHLEGIAQIYALNFTTAELRELTAMMSTPTGLKYASKQGEIAKQSMAFGARWAQGLNQELLKRIEPELRERGLKAPI